MGVEAVNMASRVSLHVTPIVPPGAQLVPSASGPTICQQCADNVAVRGLTAHVQFNSNANHFTSATAIEEIPASLIPDVKDATTVSLPIYPDSGANICLAGPKQLAELSLTRHQLRPCTKRVTAVGGSILTCTGWVLVKFEIEKQTTVQPLFFCTKVDRLYFRKQGCIGLNILPLQFLRPMPTPDPATISAVRQCRSPPPPRPTQLSSCHTRACSQTGGLPS